MKKAKFIKEITITDSETNSDVQISVYKHENNGFFAIDSSYLDQCTDEDSYPVIRDPFNAKGKVMLVEDNQISNFIGGVDMPQE